MSLRTYLVAWQVGAKAFPDGAVRPRIAELRVEADAPERAAADALLMTYGAVRPAGAPERVTVNGLAYRVDEWVEAAIYLVPESDGPARAAAERGLRHLELARKALAHFNEATGPQARAGRGIVAEIDELGARLEVLAQDLIAGRAGAP
jgi:hypothetical protein